MEDGDNGEFMRRTSVPWGTLFDQSGDSVHIDQKVKA
jgi:hypothetical protein